MRILTCSVLASLLIADVSASTAADLDYGVLRGPEYEPEIAVVDWSGFYIGAHGGYGSASLGQRDAFQQTLADHFRDRNVEAEFSVSKLIALPASRASGATYGAFAGYNVQFDEVVLGVEADYTHFGRTTTSISQIGRQYTTAAGIIEQVNLSGLSSTTIEDFGTVRARAGYALGSFLPFVTGGVAVGQVSFTDTVKVQNYGYDGKAYAANQAGASDPNYVPVYVYRHDYMYFNPANPSGGIPSSPQALSTGTRSKTVGGAALGAGLEYAVTPNILLRGEYQYVLFQDFNGHKAELNVVRGGAAVKF